MAETVKKSRIVSDEEENLEEALLEEFNLRLKSCMSKDDLHNETLEDETAPEEDPFLEDDVHNPTITFTLNKNSIASRDLIENERQHYYDTCIGNTQKEIEEVEDHQEIISGDTQQEMLGDHQEILGDIQNVVVKDLEKQNGHGDDLHVYETVPEKTEQLDQYVEMHPSPEIQVASSPEDNYEIVEQEPLTKSSIKDRLFLSTDDAAATLLFTQTVTSPMLTPSEENIDFLKGFQKDSPPKEENVYENIPGAGTNEYENVKLEESEELKKEDEHIYQDIEDCKKERDYEDVAKVNGDDDGDVTANEEVMVENTLYDAVEENNEKVYETIDEVITNNHHHHHHEEASEVEEEVQIQETTTATTNNNKDFYTEFVHHSKSESNYYEKYTEVVNTKNIEITNSNREKDTETVPAEIVKNLKSQFSKTNNETVNVQKNSAGNLKTIDIMEQINKFEQKSGEDAEDSTVTECYTETTTFQTDVPGEKALKKKKTKKSRKEEKENISVKSSFSKFDALQKKNILHIRSADSTKAQEKFNDNQLADTNNCKSCSKQVFQMEQIKAERAVWHKNCFRCTECNKQLTVETYVSHEGNLYCKPHFKSLFAPKVVEEDTPPSDKPDLGLEELQSLNVKERFQVFEHKTQETQELERGPTPVKRSSSILSKLAKFQSKGMDIGVTDDALNGIPIEESSSEEEEEEEEVPEGEDPILYRARRVQKEKLVPFTNMNEVKNKWEKQGDQVNSRDERREERKQEIQSIRNKLFMGKQGKMKEAYQQAVMQSESCANIHKSEKIESCDTKSLKERFEKGEMFNERDNQNKEEEEEEVYQSEISKKSRSLFLELDANASKAPQISPVVPQKLDVKKARETGTPEREIYHDPEIVRAEDYVDDSVIAKTTHTASKMLNKFRQMEENLSKSPEPQGPKPLKRFTPPPEPTKPDNSEEESGSEEEEDEEESEDQNDGQKLPQDLLEAQKAARARQLRAKFEKWEAEEIKREQRESVNIMEEYGDESQVESAKSLRARFESMKDSPSDKSRSAPRVKVNRFV